MLYLEDRNVVKITTPYWAGMPVLLPRPGIPHPMFHHPRILHLPEHHPIRYRPR